jgi:proliferating cell nuclear antigen PCNA
MVKKGTAKSNKKSKKQVESEEDIGSEVESDVQSDIGSDIEEEVDIEQESENESDAEASIDSEEEVKPKKAARKANTKKGLAKKKSKKSSKKDVDASVESDEAEVELDEPKPKKATKKQLAAKKGMAPKKVSNAGLEVSSKDKSKDKRILEIKCTQTGVIKQTIERISNVISDCSIVFLPPDEASANAVDDDYYEEIDENGEEISDKKSKKSAKSKKDAGTKKSKAGKSSKKNSGGIRILRLTEDKSILIKLNLDASNFEYFKCLEPKITIGVDMHNLHALLKMINDDDPIIIYMNRDNRSTLYIRSLNENNESSEETDLEIYLLEISNPDMPLPQTEFQNKITMASDKFHAICKHLNNNSTTVEITSIGSEILFRGENEGGKVRKAYKDVNYTSKKKDKSDQVVQGIYELRNLMCFSKCNKLCNTIEIYLKNDFPLVLVISVGTLGKMYVFLTPLENPTK